MPEDFKSYLGEVALETPWTQPPVFFSASVAHPSANPHMRPPVPAKPPRQASQYADEKQHNDEMQEEPLSTEKLTANTTSYEDGANPKSEASDETKYTSMLPLPSIADMLGYSDYREVVKRYSQGHSSYGGPPLPPPLFRPVQGRSHCPPLPELPTMPPTMGRVPMRADGWSELDPETLGLNDESIGLYFNDTQEGPGSKDISTTSSSAKRPRDLDELSPVDVFEYRYPDGSSKINKAEGIPGVHSLTPQPAIQSSERGEDKDPQADDISMRDGQGADDSSQTYLVRDFWKSDKAVDGRAGSAIQPSERGEDKYPKADDISMRDGQGADDSSQAYLFYEDWHSDKVVDGRAGYL
ncbi:hypothetical protein QBC45DRAFT_456710 [Copromyces sp. CBS 386.78]|nr:hypothetical protein QBC45DRAFT_456710 [Copromyces sp. CBS 386.78]